LNAEAVRIYAPLNGGWRRQSARQEGRNLPKKKIGWFK